MWQCRRRWVCVASQHSRVFFLRSKETAWQELKWQYYGGFPNWDWKNSKHLKTVTFYFWTLQEDHIPHKVTFTYLLEPFSSFLLVFPYSHQVSGFHACKGQILFQSQLVPVSSTRLLELNFLKAVGRTQIEGSCKVYAGKTNWKTSWKLYPCKQEVRSNWSTLADDSIFKKLFYFMQSMWHCRRRCV